MDNALSLDLGYLEESLSQLEDYLLSDKLFWSLGVAPPAGGRGYPSLTLGGILLALRRARSRAVSAGDLVRVERLEDELEDLRSQWRVAWGQKATRELRARLRQWGAYLNDLKRDYEEQAVYYHVEVRSRTLITLLKPSAETSDEGDAEVLAGLDRTLSAWFIPGEFIWDQNLQAGFPRQVFWYLWGKL
jgi:hypothetical protein